MISTDGTTMWYFGVDSGSVFNWLVISVLVLANILKRVLWGGIKCGLSRNAFPKIKCYVFAFFCASLIIIVCSRTLKTVGRRPTISNHFVFAKHYHFVRWTLYGGAKNSIQNFEKTIIAYLSVPTSLARAILDNLKFKKFGS